MAGLARFAPILSAAPALTAALFIGVSQLESNLITPMVQKNVAAPATPMALVIYTLTLMLYRQDVLGDCDTRAPGRLPG